MTLVLLDAPLDDACTTRSSGPDLRVRPPQQQQHTPFSSAVARMTHDIRTPLNAVIGFADLLQREFHGALGNERYREYAGHIAECGARLLSVTEQTLLLAAAADGTATSRREATVLRSLVMQAIADAKAGSGRGRVTVRCEIDGACEVEVDPPSMRYAIANLLAAASRIATMDQVLTLKLTACGGQHVLDIEMSAPAPGHHKAADAAAADGHIGIARALLRLQGLDLTFGHARRSRWSARIAFEDASQLQLL